MTSLRLGTRKSALAQTQARWVADQLCRRSPSLQIELVLLTTSGDKAAQSSVERGMRKPEEGSSHEEEPTSPLRTPRSALVPGLQPTTPHGGLKALFTKEIEEALLDRRIDLAVHSLKDMAAGLPVGLILAAVPEREDPRDAWISRNRTPFKDLPSHARIATGAIRRQAQLRHWRPDLDIIPLRGNVDTRLRKLSEGDYDGMILALAGLKRLGRAEAATEILLEDILLPAVGQGALAIETRSGDNVVQDVVQALDHFPSRQAALAERAFLNTLGGNCQTPIAAHAQVSGRQLAITGLVAHPSGQPYLRSEEKGTVSEAVTLGRRLASKLLAAGAGKILHEAQ